ncbi:pyrroloquinoline quinone precursor peptide PqqA [Streptomyces sp. NBC_01231]|nr:pyrroloquinoline quinone precursor peptide PqqA [Streptomyces sp. NBC_01231]
MNETFEYTEQPAATTSEQLDTTAWQTPGYTVVDCAMEVTAYSLSNR